MRNKSFVYTYEFLRSAFKARQGLGDLDVRAYSDLLAHLDAAEECAIPASYVAEKMKKLGWIHIELDEHGEVSARDENT
jgi:hypothetical protein